MAWAITNTYTPTIATDGTASGAVTFVVPVGGAWVIGSIENRAASSLPTEHTCALNGTPIDRLPVGQTAGLATDTLWSTSGSQVISNSVFAKFFAAGSYTFTSAKNATPASIVSPKAIFRIVTGLFSTTTPPTVKGYATESSANDPGARSITVTGGNNALVMDFFAATSAAGGSAAYSGQGDVTVVQATGSTQTMLGSSTKTANPSNVSFGWTIGGTTNRYAHAILFAATEAPAANQVAPTEITARKVFQRSTPLAAPSSGTASVPISGSYLGTNPTSFKARVKSGATTVLTANVTGVTINTGPKTFTGGTLAGVPTGGPYTLEVDSISVDGTTVIATGFTSNPFYVGDLILVTGASNAEYMFNDGFGSGSSADSLVQITGESVGSGPPYTYAETWVNTPVGAGQAALGNALRPLVTVPIGLLSTGAGGTKLHFGAVGTNWDEPASTQRVHQSTMLTNVGGKIAAVYVNVGGNDTSQGSFNGPDMIAPYRSVISNIRTETGQATLPFVLGNATWVYDGDRDAEYAALRAAVETVAGDANVYLGPSMRDLPVTSPTNNHLSGPSYTTYGGRLGRFIAKVLYGQGGEVREPVITAARRVSSTVTDVDVTIYAGTDLSPTSGNTDFTLSSDSFAAEDVVPTSVVRSVTYSGGATLRLTHTALAGATTKVRYSYHGGANTLAPVAPTYDNSTDTNALRPMPAPLTASTVVATGGKNLALMGVG